MEIEHLDHTIGFYVKKCINGETYNSGGHQVSKLPSDQGVHSGVIKLIHTNFIRIMAQST